VILARIGYSLELIGATPPAALGGPVSYTFRARGGLAPYVLTVVSEDLPADWTYVDNGDGTLTLQSASPQDAGDFSITIRVTDANRVSVDTPFSLTVIALPVSISFTSLPDGEQGTAYSGQATAQYGVAPYTYSKVAGPSWLSVNASTGAITGTPDATGTGVTVTVSVTDANGGTASVSDTIDVAAAVQGWNPSDKHADITLSGTNNVIATRATSGSGNWRGVRGVTQRGSTTTKRYFEIGINVYADNNIIAGVATLASVLTGLGAGLYGVNNWSGTTRWVNNGGGFGSMSLTAHPWATVGERIMIAVDFRAGGVDIWAGLENEWDTGDPAAGTSPLATLAAGTILCPGAWLYSDGASVPAVQYYGAPGTNLWTPPTGFTLWEAT
jgi:hypothetical protein